MQADHYEDWNKDFPEEFPWPPPPDYDRGPEVFVKPAVPDPNEVYWDEAASVFNLAYWGD